MTSLFEKIAPHIRDIIVSLQKSGYKAYVVGGAIRDILLGRTPKDYDISTSATPEQVHSVFRKRHCIIIGRRFRLVHLFCSGSEIVEISTFRRCPNAKTAQSPFLDAPEHLIFRDNEYGTPEEDAHRRDFTVNALFYDPVKDEILDYTGQGLQDIRDGIVRCIGKPDLRFEEDPIRMLRALKLVGQFGFVMEPETEASLKQSIPLIVHSSVSRMNLEVEKILRNPYGDKILEVFRKFDFLKYVLPVLDSLLDTPHGRYWFNLMRKRCERIREGKYRFSMSLVLALFTIPFVEMKCGNQPGGLWKTTPDCLWSNDEELEDFLYETMKYIFAPHAFTNVDKKNAVTNLLLQPHLRCTSDAGEFSKLLCYANARELAVIQNEVAWNIPDFETICPPGNPNMVFRSGKRKNKNSFFARKKKKKQPEPQECETK